MGAIEANNVTETDTSTLSHRGNETAKNNPLGGLMNIGNDAMEVAKVFGIGKKEIGRWLLKSALTGKLDFPNLEGKTVQRKKLEVAVDQIIKLAWTMFGIFMIFQIFLVVVGVIT